MPSKSIRRVRSNAAADPGCIRAAESADYLASLVEFSGDGILSNSLEGVIRTWNAGAERIFGYAPTEIVGRSISTLFPPERRGEERAVLARIAEGLGPQHYETVRVRKDGSPIHVSIVASPVRDAHGRLIGASKVVRDITAQKDAEAALIRSEERLRLINLATRDAVWEWDLETDILHWNPQFGMTFGANGMESTRGVEAWSRRIHPDDRDRVLARLQVFIASTETQWANEYRFQCAEGHYADVLDRAFAIRNGDGRPIRMLGAMVDLSSQKQVERRITESQQFLQATLNSLSAHIAILDHQGVVIATNEAWTRFALENEGAMEACSVGSSYLEVCDRSSELGVPEAESMGQGIRSVLRGDQALFTQEYPCHSPSTERWFIARVTRFSGGGPARVVVAHEDITARRQAENALRLSEERYQLAVEGSGAGLWDCDVKSGRLYASPRCWELLGYTTLPQLTVRVPLFLRAVHPADAQRVKSAIAAHLHRRVPYELEYRLRSANGDYVWVRASGQALWNSQGRPYRMAGSIVDITPQKKAEAEKGALESQLRQAQKMESVGTLAGGIAHDFNNILGAIIGYTELALRAAETPQMRSDLKEVLGSSHRARDLVKQILAFSRQEQPEKRTLVLQRVVENTLRLIRASVPVTVELIVTLPDAPVVVHADETQLAQVLINLASNAAQAIGPNRGRIVVRLDRLEPGAADVRDLDHSLRGMALARITVSDTGPGIPAGIMDRIYDPFFTTKPPGEGTGLGLSVVHGIVRGHHGAIRIVNSEPTGAVASVYLPLQPVDPAPGPSRADHPLGSGERILVVDDDAAAASALCRQLESLGYRVTFEQSGFQALRRFAADPDAFDLLMTDVRMPQLSGPDLAAAVCAARPGLPVILLLDSGEQAVPLLPPDTPAANVCTKTPGRSELSAAVRRALEQQHPAPAS